MRYKQRNWLQTWAGWTATTALLAGLAVVRAASPPQKRPYGGWSDYGGTADSMQYSSLKEINTRNVSKLEPVWSYPAPGPAGRFAFNPLIVDGVMYLNGKGQSVVALDAATGKQLWSHPTEGTPTNRGFNYWETKDRSDRRIIFSVNSYLQEVNARTGVTINTFGNDGKVNLREGVGRDPKSIVEIQSGTPGRIFENSIILGSAPGEMFGSPPGDLRAYDVLSGKLLWTFHTIPHPGEFGYETWPPDAWKYVGGANTWGEISIDEKRGIAYFPLGAPTYDFYGGDRLGANLFGDSLLALDARTGKRLWHFQMIHHDLWDYDPTTAPKLLTVRHNGKMVDVVAQPTKFGFVYVFDRVSGEPLWPIEERPVPQTDVPGEKSWPTQPFPTKPPAFARQKFTVDDLNPYMDAADLARYRDILLNARNEGLFTPPSLKRPSIVAPGDGGGANWGSTAVDPETGTLFIKAANAPDLQILGARAPQRGSMGGTLEQQGAFLYGQRCEICHGVERSGVGVPKKIGAERFKTIVTKGQAQMPSFGDLTGQNLDALAAYIDNPDAGAMAEAAPESSSQRPAMPPPPPGQVRFFGRYNNLMFAANGLPVLSPPWTTLTAIDLNEGTIKWQIPLGTAPELAAKGIPDTGAPRATAGGPVVTAGGLIFIGSGPERTLRAYDKANGKLLWEKQLDGSPKGIPAVYETRGRQYVAFLTVSAPQGGPESQAYHVFALPKPGSSRK
jgi:quinoprotein glucose dehydrogenase